MKTHYRKDLTGMVFGRWLINSYSHSVGSKTMWNCVCLCGNKRTVYSAHLKTGKSKSCGCLRSEQLSKRLITHGLTGSRLQIIHTHMKQRCKNKNCKEYKNYGARGITVDENFETFISFKNWALSSGYSDDLSIDRIDNDKGYSPENCRWVNSSVQNSNQRIKKSNTSGFVGVTERKGKWRARIDYEGKSYNIGTFLSPIEAAIARDSLVVESKFPHKLNFKKEEVAHG